METLWGLFCLFMVLVCMIPILQGYAHRKEKDAKMELMRRHPEHAVEIQKAIDLQEMRFQTQMHQPWKPPAAAKKGGGLGKLVVVGLCIAYIVFPIDFIPDVIPVLGWGDDVVAGIIGLRALIK
jgi:uncharacterized membrane protein YkvA (DUF1232 family)